MCVWWGISINSSLSSQQIQNLTSKILTKFDQKKKKSLASWDAVHRLVAELDPHSDTKLFLNPLD